jgi:rubrerythrin
MESRKEHLMKTAHDAIADFLDAELAARDFYHALGQMTVNPEVKTLTHELAAEDEQHCQMLQEWLTQSQDPVLQGIHQEVGHRCEEPSDQTTTTLAGKTASPAELASPWRAVELAIVRELDSLLALLHLHTYARDSFGRSMVAHLRQAKERRKLLLEEQLRKLRKQERWAA